MLIKRKKKILLCFIIISLFLLSSNKVNAYVGNGFVWNQTEISVDLNSNFDDYIEEFEVTFYYKGTMTDEPVKVSLDYFYYGNLTISTSTVETKIVKMIATVPGYSSYDRRDILVHVVDTEFPKITKIKELDFEVGQVVNYDEYFMLSDNDKIESYQYNDSKVNYSVPGTYPLSVNVSDVSGHIVSENFNVVISDKGIPDIIISNYISVEYGDLDFDIKRYVKANDSFEGDLSDNVVMTGLDVYKLGDQSVTIAVSDSNGNTRRVNKIITVVDTKAPTLELTRYNDTIYLGDDPPDFSQYIKACYDNTCDIDTSKIEIDSMGFNMLYGTYTITYKIKDDFNNYCVRKLNLNVSYKESPIIVCRDLEFKQNEIFDLTEYISVSDKYDDSVSEHYQIYSDAVDNKTPGKYEVVVEATNMAGHSTIEKFYVTIAGTNSLTEDSLFDIYEYIYENKVIIIITLIVITVVVIVIYKKKKQTKTSV